MMVRIVVIACIVAAAWFAILAASLFAIVQMEGKMSERAVRRFRVTVLLSVLALHVMMLVAFAVWGKEQAMLILC